MNETITLIIIVSGMDTRHVYVRAHWRQQNGRNVFVRSRSLDGGGSYFRPAFHSAILRCIRAYIFDL